MVTNAKTPLDNPDGMNLDTAEGWRPEVGDVIIGVVTDIARGFSDYRESYYPIVTIQPDEGSPVAVHCFHTVLLNRMVELKPKIGETIGIKFVKGSEKSTDKGKRGNTASIYNVRVKGRSDSDIWNSMPQDE